MDKAPELVTSVEFDVVRKGYDPEQVDNYLKGVGDQVARLKGMLRSAVEAAEVAEAKAAEASRQKAVADAAREEALSDLESARKAPPKVVTAPGGDPRSAEELQKVLMLAQRTADSAVEEAQESAKNIVADGRSKAAEVVADAETRAERILVEAQKVAEETVKERTGAIEDAVHQLEGRRSTLMGDIEVLSRHLAEQRARLRKSVDALAALVDDGGDLAVTPAPDLGAPPEASRTEAPPAPAPEAPAPEAEVPKAPAPKAAAPKAEAPPAPAGKAPSPGTAPPAAGLDRPAPSVTVPITPGPPAGSASRVADLLEGPAGEGGPPTEPIPAAERDALLAEDEADAEAMRRFFEDDLEIDDPKKGRFGRKR